MRSTYLLLLAIATLLCSCSNPAERQYLGTWVNKEHHGTIRIKKDGDNFVMETMRDNKVAASEEYTMKDGKLQGTMPLLDSLMDTKYITYVNATGHLSLQGIAWEKSDN